VGDEHLEGYLPFHDVVFDEYFYGKVNVQASTEEVRITIANGVDGAEAESLVTNDPATVVFFRNCIETFRRMQGR
jgi:hypothetical protein